jgi:hypothetical protein
MDNEFKAYKHIISDIKNGLIQIATENNTELRSNYFSNDLNRLIDKFLQESPYYKEKYNTTEIAQKKLKKYIFELAEKLFNNQKFIAVMESIKEKKAEIEKLEQEIEELASQGKLMLEERESLYNFINFEGINQLLTNNGGEEVSANTLSKWNNKGLLGEALTEKDICPNSFENHRTVYFSKEKVLDFLIKEGKITPKYEILDQIEEGTVLKYVITKENQLGYYCKEFDTGIETVVK